MSWRRKQANPQFILPEDTTENFASPTFDLHVCEQCCAEFVNRTDLNQHQEKCFKDQPGLLVAANKSPDFPPSVFIYNSSPFKIEEQWEDVKKNNDTKEPDEDKTEEKILNTFDDISCDIATNSHGDERSGVLPRENGLLDLCKLSAINSNVFIENLQNTQVAVAQFPQESTGIADNSKIAASGLMEHLSDLQQQQMQQLKLIEEIQRHILLLAAQNTDTPMASSQIKLTSNVSERLAATTEQAENPSSQCANAKHSRHISQTFQNDSCSDKENYQLADQIRGNSMPLKVGRDLCSSQSLHDNTVPDKVHGLTNLKEQPPPLITVGILNKLELFHEQNALPSISAVVEDLNPFTALAQQRKAKPLNVTFDHKRASEDCALKHKCRFCAKAFGSYSALQIHLRSHTGERPYKCNICGNRFSTRGNLKVHFLRHKEKYPNIQMNPYPVPEHLDNIPTSKGILYGMSFPPEKPVPEWMENKHSAGKSIGYITPSSLPTCPPIKIEDKGVSVTKPHYPGVTEVGERRVGHQEGYSNNPQLIPKEKFQEVDQPLSLSKFKTVFGDWSRNLIATNKASDSRLITELKVEKLETNFVFGRPLPLTGTSETSKLEHMVENIEKKSSNPNECVICHRVLSCQSALKMHYRTHTGERPFKCRVCGRAFTTKGNLKTHYSIHRSMPLIRIQHSCPICQEKFTNAIVLQQHIHMHMGGHIPNFPLQDNYPDSMDQDTDLISENNLRVVNPTDYKEEDGKNSDTSSDSLTSDPASSEFIRATEPECQNSNVDTKFTMQNGFMHGDHPILKSSSLRVECQSHGSNSVHNETRDIWNPPSPNSSASGLHEYSLSDRQLMSSSAESHCSSLSYPNYRLQDGPSGDMSKDSTTMIFSVSERESQKSNVCDICNKMFACQSALEIHYRSHTKERPFICSTCNRGFSTKGNLKQHMLTHQMRDLGSQLFEPANKVFAPNQFQSITSFKRVELDSSIKTVPKDSPAGEAGSSVSTLPKLSTASVTATSLRRSAKQHFCHTCGKTFSSSSALQIHERTHTGEKPFACNICGRAFTTKGNLKVHMGTHMWSNSPARRGRRLSVDASFLSSNPERFPNISPKDVAGRVHIGDSEHLWNPFASLTSGLALKANEMPFIRNGSLSRLSSGYLGSFEQLHLNRT